MQQKRLQDDQIGTSQLLGEFDDSDDMFADIPLEPMKRVKLSNVTVESVMLAELHDDADGFLVLGPGEILSSPTQNYKILGVAGKGAYSTVFRASRTTDGLNVAIKVLRNNPTTHRAGMKESGILEKIFDSDEQSRRFIVELIENVKVKGHYCLVFEALGMNLRDLLQKYGKGVGLKVSAIQIYARQAFAALAILRKCNVIHADIKPDNVLVSEKLNTAKICDFGTAMTAPFNDLVPYLASRFYRAPEIVLGLPLGCELDVWSLGCTLFELATDRVLFPGRSNGHLLHLMMEARGRFPMKMIRKSRCSFFDFSKSCELVFDDVDSPSGAVTKKRISLPGKAMRAIGSYFPDDSTDFDTQDRQALVNLIDLIERCLELDPERRISPKSALGHPFLRI